MPFLSRNGPWADVERPTKTYVYSVSGFQFAINDELQVLLYTHLPVQGARWGRNCSKDL
jgi:hypothetical protein